MIYLIVLIIFCFYGILVVPPVSQLKGVLLILTSAFIVALVGIYVVSHINIKWEQAKIENVRRQEETDKLTVVKYQKVTVKQKHQKLAGFMESGRNFIYFEIDGNIYYADVTDAVYPLISENSEVEIKSSTNESGTEYHLKYLDHMFELKKP